MPVRTGIAAIYASGSGTLCVEEFDHYRTNELSSGAEWCAVGAALGSQISGISREARYAWRMQAYRLAHVLVFWFLFSLSMAGPAQS